MRGAPKEDWAMVQMETQLQSIFEEVVVSGRARDPERRLGEGETGQQIMEPGLDIPCPFVVTPRFCAEV